MRHNKKHGLKIGSDSSHTKAMKRNLVCALFLNDRIKTTQTRAKAIRGDVDRVITWAKRGDLHSRRLAIAKLNRCCGFTRIYKLGPRKGDNAPMVLMELVTEPCTPKAKKAKAAPVAETKVVEEAPAVEETAAVESEAPAAEEKAE